MTSTTTRIRGDLASTPPHTSPDRLPTGRLEAAHARWNDYLGSAAADDSGAVLGRRSLYEIARLDRERWTIVGIEVSLGDALEQVVLYAVDRVVKPANSEEVDEMAVTAFHLGAGTQVDEFLREAFDRVNLRLMSTMAVDRYLRVDDHVQLPRPTE
jgi:hypothetical protein